MEQFDVPMRASQLPVGEQNILAAQLGAEIERELNVDVRHPNQYFVHKCEEDGKEVFPQIRIPGQSHILQNCIVQQRMVLTGCILYTLNVEIPRKSNSTFPVRVECSVSQEDVDASTTAETNNTTSDAPSVAVLTIAATAALLVFAKMVHDSDSHIATSIKEILQSLQNLIH